MASRKVSEYFASSFFSERSHSLVLEQKLPWWSPQNYLVIGLDSALASEYYTENFVAVVSIGKRDHDLFDYT